GLFFVRSQAGTTAARHRDVAQSGHIPMLGTHTAPSFRNGVRNNSTFRLSHAQTPCPNAATERRTSYAACAAFHNFNGPMRLFQRASEREMRICRPSIR
ncbi:hypothetical protein, partial [Burkholderia vietnamiensis]|uniref:hypothetical protein n=1 Tax=Burkholderia vietnamiensis TaxID=60552 RepID=UPI003F49B196